MSELLIEDDDLAMDASTTADLPDQPGGGSVTIIPEPLKEFGKGYLTGWANVFAFGGRGVEATGRTINRPFVRYPRAEHPYLNRAGELPPWVEINSLGIPYAPAGVLGPEPVSLENITIPTIRDLDIGGVRIEGMDVADEERKREFFTPDPKLKQVRELNAYLTQAEEMNDPAAYALTKVGQGIAWVGETALDSFPSWQRHPKLMGRDWKELLADPETRWLYLGRVYGESLPQVAAALGVTVGVSAATANPALGVTAGAGFSYALATGESVQAFKDLGASDEEAAETACLVGLVSAAVETVPLGRFMQKTPGFKQIFTSRLQQHLGKKLIQDLTFRNAYKEAFKQGLTEGGTEAIQHVIQNYGKSFFNDNQDLFEGVDEAAFVAFLMGNTYSHAGQLASRAFVVSDDRLALKDKQIAEAAADLERLKTWQKMDAPRPTGTSKTRMAKRLEIELSKQMEPEKARMAAEMGAWEVEQRARRWAAYKGRHPEEWWDRFLPQAALPDEGKVTIRDGAKFGLSEEGSNIPEGGEPVVEKWPEGASSGQGEKVGEETVAVQAESTTDWPIGFTQGYSARQDVTHQILESEEWKLATDGDMKMADSIINRVWTDRDTDAVKVRLAKYPEAIFISQPSTSRKNFIPKKLALRLADEFGTSALDGDAVFDPMHENQMKDLPMKDRPFSPPVFDPVNIGELRGKVGNKPLVIVEDIYSTGGSVHEFARALKNQGFNVVDTVALMGDVRFRAEPQLATRLKKTLNRNGIEIDSKALTGVLPRGAVLAIIDDLNTRGKIDESARKEITRNLQGILNRGIGNGVGKDAPRASALRSIRGPESGVGPDRGTTPGDLPGLETQGTVGAIPANTQRGEEALGGTQSQTKVSPRKGDRYEQASSGVQTGSSTSRLEDRPPLVLGEYDRAAFADRRIEAAGQGFEALSLVQMREKPLLKAPAESRPAPSPQPNPSTLSDTVNSFTKELAGDYKCPDAGYVLKVDYDSVKHAFWFGRGEGKADSDLVLAMRSLPQLIDSAIALEKNIPPSKHDKHKRPSDMLWAPLVIDGRLYAVRMRVEHQPGGKRHLYHVEVENWSNPAPDLLEEVGFAPEPKIDPNRISPVEFLMGIEEVARKYRPFLTK